MTITQNQLNWFQQIFFEYFGVKFIFEIIGNNIVIRLNESNKTILFSNSDQEFYRFGKTNLNCYEWNAEIEGFFSPLNSFLKAPSTNPLPEILVSFNDNGAIINYDILGLTYWMLNRLEEIGRNDLDNHERFPATVSHAYKYNYLDRPIVDEWFDILKQTIQKVWPNIKFKEHQFCIKVSHDVDAPSDFSFLTPLGLLKKIAVLIIKKKNIKLAMLAPYIYLNGRKKIHHLDPLNTFNWLMKISEKNNLTSAFYFICGRTDKRKDAQYDLNHPIIKSLISEIYRRGHEVGLHPSYNSFNNPQQISAEAKYLKNICKEIGVVQDNWGGRMHYLRWSHPHTLQAWNDANMNYDSSLGYADLPGFRCGTCHEYTGYNPLTDTILNLKIRPLIVMDCTVVANHYLGLGYTKEALNKILEYKNLCRKFNGNFTFLWHNSFFSGPSSFELYKDIIES